MAKFYKSCIPSKGYMALAIPITGKSSNSSSAYGAWIVVPPTPSCWSLTKQYLYHEISSQDLYTEI